MRLAPETLRDIETTVNNKTHVLWHRVDVAYCDQKVNFKHFQFHIKGEHSALDAPLCQKRGSTCSCCVIGVAAYGSSCSLCQPVLMEAYRSASVRRPDNAIKCLLTSMSQISENVINSPRVSKFFERTI